MLRFLIVEDTSEVVKVFMMLLRGHKIKTTPLLNEGIEAMTKESFDIILLDLTLDDSTEDQTVARIPEIENLIGEARLIIVTGQEWLGQKLRRERKEVIFKSDHDWLKQILYALVPEKEHAERLRSGT